MGVKSCRPYCGLRLQGACHLLRGTAPSTRLFGLTHPLSLTEEGELEKPTLPPKEGTEGFKRNRNSRNGKRKGSNSDAPRGKRNDYKRQRQDKDDSRHKWDNQHRNTTVIPHNKYHVGWICALPVELAAAQGMLDKIYERLPQPSNDSNTYTLGTMSGHNIVIACLPTDGYGTNNAAIVATHMQRTFSSICVWLLVGIGGGVPGKVDIRLGDVVVSTKVVQSDLGKIEQDGRLRQTGLPRAPSNALLTAIAAIQAKHRASNEDMSRFLQILLEEPRMAEYARPSIHSDLLFDSHYEHKSRLQENCNDCDKSRLVVRDARADGKPVVHYGTIASANQVMRDARTRDQMVQNLDNVCFEMEAAGVMGSCASLVIRGICDYSDSHKNKHWQGYAAATAVAYAKELLSIIPFKDGPEAEIQREMSTVQHATAHQIKDIKAGENARLIFHSNDTPLCVTGVSAGDNATEFFGSGGHLLLREVLKGPTRGKVQGDEEMIEKVTSGSGSGARDR